MGCVGSEPEGYVDDSKRVGVDVKVGAVVIFNGFDAEKIIASF
jgi:hypothetical protein